jgi:XTP/dITP diphosphohydrolase
MTEAVREELLGIPLGSAITWEDRNRGILKLLEGQIDRSAAYVSTMVLRSADEKHCLSSEGQMPLIIIPDYTPRGSHGFGYDPIVLPVMDGLSSTHTVAELTTDEKNKLSHRGRALMTLINQLEYSEKP